MVWAIAISKKFKGVFIKVPTCGWDYISILIKCEGFSYKTIEPSGWMWTINARSDGRGFTVTWRNGMQTLILDVADILCVWGEGLWCWMSQPLISDAADAESRCCRHVLLGVANIIFQCCRCCVSMLQTCDVRCCVEEKGEEAPDVGCCTQHGSQYSRNMGRTEERLLMLDVASNRVRNKLATCSQHLFGGL
jgi:hypothetical protein